MKPALRDLGDIGNVIAAVGVIVSLLVVAWEIRGNTAALRAEASLQMIELGNQSFDWVKNPEFAELMVRVSENPDSMTDSELVQYFAYSVGILNMWEQGFLLHRNGLMDDDVWEGWNAGMTAAFDDPGVRRIWESSNSFFSEDFRFFVQGIAARLDAG